MTGSTHQTHLSETERGKLSQIWGGNNKKKICESIEPGEEMFFFFKATHAHKTNDNNNNQNIKKIESVGRRNYCGGGWSVCSREVEGTGECVILFSFSFFFFDGGT